MKLLNRKSTVLMALLATLALTACGGGSSSGADSGSTTEKSSSIVVQLSPNLATNEDFLQSQDSSTHFTAVVSDLLVRNALAQTAGVKVYVDRVEVGQTDSFGNFAVAVLPGPHTVCVDDPLDPAKCMDLNVAADEVVVVSGVDLDVNGILVAGAITSESAFDNIVLFQDPDKSHKTLVCHKGKTISVGTPAALSGHKVHGDIPGECVGAEQVVNNDTDDGDSSAGNKVTVCHRTGNGSRTITISESSLTAHLGHGDATGACTTS